ncbi:MAG: hypothetical protein J0H37_03380 [Hyphomicrobium denitrificans]|jgi:hypothetical protein|nr:hypothetical protein [Hyphomicrobium denitrificans]
MSTYRFPLRGKIGVIRGLSEQLALRLGVVKRGQAKSNVATMVVQDIVPLTDEQIRNLPVAHRCSA